MNLGDVLIRLIADGLVVVVVFIGAISYFTGVTSDRWQQYTRAFMAGLSAYTAGKLLSLIYTASDERPFLLLGVQPKAAYLNNPGFPSDHALFVAAITLVVAFAVRNRRLTILLVGLSLLVGIGRVAALVHTPVDILGGYLAAVLGVVPWYAIAPRANKHK